MQSQDIAHRIRTFIYTQFPRFQQANLTDKDSLLTQGVIDSLGILDLVTFLENEYRISITDDDLQPENFQSITEISNFVAAKIKNGSPENYGDA